MSSDRKIVLVHTSIGGSNQWQVMPNAMSHHGVVTDGPWDRVLELIPTVGAYVVNEYALVNHWQRVPE